MFELRLYPPAQGLWDTFSIFNKLKIVCDTDVCERWTMSTSRGIKAYKLETARRNNSHLFWVCVEESFVPWVRGCEGVVSRLQAFP